MIDFHKFKKNLIRYFPLTKKVSRRFCSYRRTFFEQINSDRYSRPSASEIDQKLESYLPDRGFFIEAGAHDGFFQSNTYYLEKFRNWSGILVEPIRDLYRECVRQRPEAKVFNSALVAFDYSDSELKMISADGNVFCPAGRTIARAKVKISRNLGHTFPALKRQGLRVTAFRGKNI